jgi:hypothetical protein
VARVAVSLVVYLAEKLANYIVGIQENPGTSIFSIADYEFMFILTDSDR